VAGQPERREVEAGQGGRGAGGGEQRAADAREVGEREVGEREVEGIIDAVDGEGLARVLIGTAEVEWFFPLEMLPEGVGEGDAIRFGVDEGAYFVIGRGSRAANVRSIEDRMSRRMHSRKTAELDAVELRRQLAAEA